MLSNFYWGQDWLHYHKHLLFVVFISFLATSHAVIDVHNCDSAESVTYLGPSYKSIYSHCNCTITTNFTGTLYFVSQYCSNNIYILNNKDSIPLSCSGIKKTSKTNFTKGDKLFMISTFVNNFPTESTISNQVHVILIHARKYISFFL